MEDFYIREANESDCEQLYTWANEESVRNNAFDSNKINYSDHQEWFKNKLKSADHKIFMVYRYDQPIGQLRIDIEQGVGVIDYSIDHAYRGRGYGSELIKHLSGIVHQYDLPISKLVGKVKYQNKASIKAFNKANFRSDEYDTHIEFYKELLD
ncbi:GNAT family N-acetyltransferase [Alkalibacillus salilacus]|uniref:Spore coat polysaccharide biosynthesis protein SpsF n=1 Tax=Alkalibacillus salilacus TaxID=284582 RepID=A0ABT9VF33_9BACI|nr:GNAT family N-acetyltransferase [Alkalibacillus salilacus]MDQ0159581.1 spore coat polysaccharide biosynthesis protein SpsF [Alkalibacillus salilacus]